jgi:hypothetical protein
MEAIPSEIEHTENDETSDALIPHEPIESSKRLFDTFDIVNQKLL